MNLVLATSFLGLKVKNKTENHNFGKVRQILFSIDKGQLLGLKVGKFVLPSLFVELSDIEEIRDGTVVLKPRKKIMEIKQHPQAHFVEQKGHPLIGNIVVTESKKRVGRVSDLAICFDSGTIEKIYIRCFLQDRIIPVSDIIEISKRKVVIKEDLRPLSAVTA